MSKARNEITPVDVDRELAALDALPGVAQAAPIALAAGLAMQQQGGRYATAVMVQRPRQMGEVQRRLKEEARLAGADFYYGWGAGKDKIEGPSVKLAMAAARCWGNCAVELLPIQETADAWIFGAAFVDLETGFTLTRQFRQSKKWTVHGKHDAERKDDIRFQVGQSKASRNVVLNALPASLIELALKESQEGVRDRIEAFIMDNGLPAATDLLIRGLAKHGVTQAQILSRCGVAETRGLSVDHLVLLKGDLHAIQQGQERPEDLFPQVQADRVTEQLRQRVEQVPQGEPPRQDAMPQPKTKSNGKLTSDTERQLREAAARLEISDEQHKDLYRAVGLPTDGSIPPSETQGRAMLAILREQEAERQAMQEEANANG